MVTKGICVKHQWGRTDAPCIDCIKEQEEIDCTTFGPNTLAGCNQDGCPNRAAYRFTWPGRDEAGICAIHAEKAKVISNAMGFHLQLIPIGEV